MAENHLFNELKKSFKNNIIKEVHKKSKLKRSKKLNENYHYEDGKSKKKDLIQLTMDRLRGKTVHNKRIKEQVQPGSDPTEIEGYGEQWFSVPAHECIDHFGGTDKMEVDPNDFENPTPFTYQDNVTNAYTGGEQGGGLYGGGIAWLPYIIREDDTHIVTTRFSQTDGGTGTVGENCIGMGYGYHLINAQSFQGVLQNFCYPNQGTELFNIPFSCFRYNGPQTAGTQGQGNLGTLDGLSIGRYSYTGGINIELMSCQDIWDSPAITGTAADGTEYLNVPEDGDFMTAGNFMDPTYFTEGNPYNTVFPPLEGTVLANPSTGWAWTEEWSMNMCKLGANLISVVSLKTVQMLIVLLKKSMMS
jgi:hypothetical protein